MHFGEFKITITLILRTNKREKTFSTFRKSFSILYSKISTECSSFTSVYLLQPCWKESLSRTRTATVRSPGSPSPGCPSCRGPSRARQPPPCCGATWGRSAAGRSSRRGTGSQCCSRSVARVSCWSERRALTSPVWVIKLISVSELFIIPLLTNQGVVNFSALINTEYWGLSVSPLSSDRK